MFREFWYCIEELRVGFGIDNPPNFIGSEVIRRLGGSDPNNEGKNFESISFSMISVNNYVRLHTRHRKIH